MTIDTAEIVAILGGLVTTVGGGLAVGWRWFTSLVDRLQNDRNLSDDRFREEVKTARADFFTGLEKLETRRDATDRRVIDALAGIETILAERSVVPPLASEDRSRTGERRRPDLPATTPGVT